MTHVALQIAAAWAGHLVTAILFDKLLFAFVAGSNQGSCHSLFDFMAAVDLVVLGMLFTRHRNVRDAFAAATADLLAFGVGAAEFEVFFYLLNFVSSRQQVSHNVILLNRE